MWAPGGALRLGAYTPSPEGSVLGWEERLRGWGAQKGQGMFEEGFEE